VLEQQRGRGVIGEGEVGLVGAAERETPRLEAAGAFEEVTPGMVNLQADTGEGFLAPTAEALMSVGQERTLIGYARENGWIKELPTGEDEFSMPITPETEREAALRQIRINSFDEGISQREAFGTFIEGIPAVGSIARKWVGGLVETPSRNADIVIGHINRIKEDASTGQEKVRNGLEDPEYGLTRAREMEEEIAALEGRIKLLINTSPILRANTDEVNKMQEEILETKRKVDRYRTASTFGLTAELTGTGRQVPTDEQMFFELKDYNERG
jgi:hypothetical protein